MRVRHAILAVWMSLIAWPAPTAAQPGRARGFDLPRIEVGAASRVAGPAPVGGYLRFYVCELPRCGDSDTAERGPGGDRDWIGAWLTERDVSRILTLRLDLARPDFSATAILAGAPADGNRPIGGGANGRPGPSRYLTPYFRVDAATMATVTVRLVASRGRTAVTPAVLDIVRRGAMRLQPAGSLVTSLNSGQLRGTSDFVDESVSRLFAENLTERAVHQLRPGEGSDGFPIDIRAEVGSWRVMATPPRISMFSEVGLHGPASRSADGACAGIEPGPDLQACRAFAGLSPQRVLGLAVGENLTLGGALLADRAISAELTRLASGPAAEREGIASAHRLCELVAAKADALGFNRYDAAAAVWAFTREAQVDQARRLLVLGEGSCEAAATLRRARLV